MQRAPTDGQGGNARGGGQKNLTRILVLQPSDEGAFPCARTPGDKDEARSLVDVITHMEVFRNHLDVRNGIPHGLPTIWPDSTSHGRRDSSAHVTKCPRFRGLGM